MRYACWVNFIGHAKVALWQRADPEFVLGSMLPDFAGMARTRLRKPEVAPPALAAEPRRVALHEGIALHHRTDDAFHAAPPFVALLQETLDELSALGVPRGSARAVGHVGVEMFIDGELICEPAVAAAYTRALNVGAGLDHVFLDRAGAERWELLRQRLIAYGAPYDYGHPESVLTRLQLMLRGRPRLAIDAAALPLLRQALPGLQRKVRAELSTLLSVVRAHLS
ncbi:MAG: hypothetical protein JWN48_1133 [Myxococcaceae bacterium]|nr:hypothetical protein [Myxococcaceae bacterium]